MPRSRAGRDGEARARVQLTVSCINAEYADDITSQIGGENEFPCGVENNLMLMGGILPCLIWTMAGRR